VIKLILSQTDIVKFLKAGQLKVDPQEDENIQCNGIDLRLGNEIVRIKTCSETFNVHEKNDFEIYYQKEIGSSFVISPGEKVLVCTLERIELPSTIIGFVGLRSTYTRLGLSMPLGFVEAGFIGQLTLELNGGSFPIRIHSQDRLFHIVFAYISSNAKIKYEGKYQYQKGVTLPILDIL